MERERELGEDAIIWRDFIAEVMLVEVMLVEVV